MAKVMIFSIIVEGVAGIQGLHYFGDIRAFAGLKQKLVKPGHQALGIELEIIFFFAEIDDAEKLLVIGGLFKKRLVRIAPYSDVINSLAVYAWFSHFLRQPANP